MQVGGAGYRIASGDLQRALDISSTLRKLLLRYVQKEEALASARQLWAAAIIAGNDLTSYRFEITDEGGALLLVLRFNEALPPALRPRSG